MATDASSDTAGEEAATASDAGDSSKGTDTPSDAGVTWVKVTETSAEAASEAEEADSS